MSPLTVNFHFFLLSLLSLLSLNNWRLRGPSILKKKIINAATFLKIGMHMEQPKRKKKIVSGKVRFSNRNEEFIENEMKWEGRKFVFCLFDLLNLIFNLF